MQSIFRNHKTHWKVQIYVGHKPDGDHYFDTKQEAYDFYVEASLSLLQSTIGGTVDLPVELEAWPFLKIAHRL